MNQSDVFATRAYVIGEIVLSVVALLGAGYILAFTANMAAQTTAGAVLGAVTTFWFTRRAGEQATNNVREVANGRFDQLSERIDRLLEHK